MKKLLKLFIFALVALVSTSAAHANVYQVGNTVFATYESAWRQSNDLDLYFGIKAPIFPIVQSTEENVGAINYVTGGQTYRLQSSISSTQTTINLSSFKEPVSNIPYTMTYLNAALEYATLDPQTSSSEFISFTGITQNSDGTATLTGVSRGLGRSYPYTASTTLARSHSGQSIFILSNTPQVYNDIYTYINNASYAGTVDASQTVKGVVETATGAEAARHAADGSGNTTGALALTASIASSTRVANTPLVVVASTTGFIDNSFIATSTAQTSGDTIFTNITLPGKTTIATTTATTTIVGSFPIYSIGKNIKVYTSGVNTFTIPQGVAKIWVRAVGGGGGGGSGNNSTTGGGGGGAGSYCEGFMDVTATTSINVTIGSGGSGGGSGNPGSTGGSTLVSNYCTAAGGIGGGGSSLSFAGGAGGTATGGDINLSGGGGGAGTPSTFPMGGTGGNSPLGGGASSVSAAGTGVNGMANTGGGGSGSAGTAAGGTGGSGIAIIAW